jgi:hypothetical protein
MNEVERLKAENQDLRRQLREARLEAAGRADQLEEVQREALRVMGCARRPVHDAVQERKFRHEAYIGRVLSRLSQAQKVTDRIEEALGSNPQTDVCTLEDLQFVSRDTIASIHGVGPTALKLLDAAMAEHGLTWVDEAQATRAGQVLELPRPAHVAVAA